MVTVMHVAIRGTTKTHPEEKKEYPFASIFIRAINIYALRFCPETGVKRSFCKLPERSQLLIIYVFQFQYMIWKKRSVKLIILCFNENVDVLIKN